MNSLPRPGKARARAVEGAEVLMDSGNQAVRRGYPSQIIAPIKVTAAGKEKRAAKEKRH
jgi:hypothetical protein